MTFNFLKSVYDYLLLLGILLFSLTFLIDKNQCVDIHVHDTYYVIEFRHIFRILSSLLIFIWILYKLVDSILFSKQLTKVHVYATFLFIGLVISLIYWKDIPIYKNQFAIISGNGFWDYFGILSTEIKMFAICILVTISFQILLPINILLGLMKRIRK